MVSDKALLAAIKSSTSMSEAAAKLKIHFHTFKSHALKLGVYTPNQGGRGKRKQRPKILLNDILAGDHPAYQSFILKHRLFEEGVKQKQCELCGLSNEWCGEPLSLELDHIDGDRSNHRLKNLRIVCPNCHSQTPTFKFKKRAKL